MSEAAKPTSDHLDAFKAWALAENASPYAEWYIRRRDARALFEELRQWRRLVETETARADAAERKLRDA